jgi:two-component system sensor histidine kinase BaeS
MAARASGRVRLTLARRTDQVVIDVEDSPPGVPAGDLLRLFDPLFRVESARSRRVGGSGLGLAICEALVRSHGGTIAATNSELGADCVSA